MDDVKVFMGKVANALEEGNKKFEGLTSKQDAMMNELSNLTTAVKLQNSNFLNQVKQCGGIFEEHNKRFHRDKKQLDKHEETLDVLATSKDVKDGMKKKFRMKIAFAVYLLTFGLLVGNLYYTVKNHNKKPNIIIAKEETLKKIFNKE